MMIFLCRLCTLLESDRLSMSVAICNSKIVDTTITPAIATTAPAGPLDHQSSDSGFETGTRQSPAPPPPGGPGPGPPPSIQGIPNAPATVQNCESRKTKVLKRLSFPLAWMESLSGESGRIFTRTVYVCVSV